MEDFAPEQHLEGLQQHLPSERHHSPLRLILVLGFFAMLLVGSQQAGQEYAHQWPEMIPFESEEPLPEAFDMPLAEVSPAMDVAIAAEEVPMQGVIHIETPEPIRGIYLTGYSAGNQRTMERIYKLIEETGINTVVVDIKDATGRISYQPRDPELQASGVGTNRIKDLASLVTDLHERGIYIIGRLSVFQDPYYVNHFPEEGYTDSRTGGIWRDYKGIAWLRADSQKVWQYAVAIAKDAYVQGFDEINLDYVRFPSDGPLAALTPYLGASGRMTTIQSFFAYMDGELRGSGIPLSADLFGLTMSASDDLGIGQKLELIAPHVDYVCPMVYPSHFAPGAYGIAVPAANPGAVIRQSLSRGIAKLEAVGIGKEKLRPWLQDFNLGATYTEALVRDQIDESEKLGLTSWLMWDPRNLYTKAALIPRTGPMLQ